MPLDLTLAASSALMSPDSVAPGVAIDEQLLFELPGRLGVDAPIWARLAHEAYDDPELSEREVELLAAEVRTLRAALTGGDDTSATRETLDRLLFLCEAALVAGLGIAGVSD